MADLMTAGYLVIASVAKGDTSTSSRQSLEFIAKLKQIAAVATLPRNDDRLLRLRGNPGTVGFK